MANDFLSLLTTCFNNRGFLAAGLVFMFYGMSQLRDGPFIRPHPVFWRGVQAVSLMYLMLMIYLFFQVCISDRSCLQVL
jgi:phosphatidylserine synthase 2